MSVRVSASDVIVTHGTNMALFMALMSITNPGDNILVPSNGDTFFCNTSQVSRNIIFIIFRNVIIK